MSIVRRPFSVNSSVYKDQTLNNITTNITSSIPFINSSITPANTAGSLAYDPNLQAIYYSNGESWFALGGGSSGGNSGSVTNVTDLRAYPATNNPQTVILEGDVVAGDGITSGVAGVYYYDPTDTTSPDNGVTVIVASNSSTPNARWKLLPMGQFDASYGNFGSYATETETIISANQVSLTVAETITTVPAVGANQQTESAIFWNINPTANVPSGAPNYTALQVSPMDSATNANNIISGIIGVTVQPVHQSLGTLNVLNGIYSTPLLLSSGQVVGNVLTTYGFHTGVLQQGNFFGQSFSSSGSASVNNAFGFSATGPTSVTGILTVSNQMVGYDVSNISLSSGYNVGYRVNGLIGGTNPYGFLFQSAAASTANGITWSNSPQTPTIASNWYYNGSFQLRNDYDTSARHSITHNSITSLAFALGTGSNNGGTAATINSVLGTDQDHQISITTSSTAPAASAIIYTCTYVNSFPTGSIVTASPGKYICWSVEW